MEAARRTLVTEAEFLALGESTQPMELIDGEVVLAPSSTVRHQETLLRVAEALRSWARAVGDNIFVGVAPLDVRFGQGRILQPDAFVILGGVSPDHEGPIDAVPEVCVEVLSANRLHDRVTKRFIYAESGVRELWLIEPLGPVERRTGPGLVEVDLVSDHLESPLLPGFSVDVASLVP